MRDVFTIGLLEVYSFFFYSNLFSCFLDEKKKRKLLFLFSFVGILSLRPDYIKIICNAFVCAMYLFHSFLLL